MQFYLYILHKTLPAVMCERLPLDKADSPSHDLVLPPKANKQTVKTKLKLDPLCKSFMQIFYANFCI